MEALLKKVQRIMPSKKSCWPAEAKRTLTMASSAPTSLQACPDHAIARPPHAARVHRLHHVLSRPEHSFLTPDRLALAGLEQKYPGHPRPS